MTIVERHKTAVARVDFSRPVRLALESGVLSTACTVLDYGCGRGDDVRGLNAKGISAVGWDPVHSPTTEIADADVVNLGYVVNVIEDPAERREALLDAWRLTRKVLLVSVRLVHEARGMKLKPLGDGFITQRGTFQHFFTQQEFRSWLDASLGVATVPAAPGILYAFRDTPARQAFIASAYRRALRAPTVRQSDILFEKHRNLLGSLSDFVTERGRLPGDGELATAPEVMRAFGSLKRAFSVLRRVTSSTEWEAITEARAKELLIYLALDRFGGRPKFSELPPSLALDVKAFFGAYTRACREADALLFSAGDMPKVDHACRDAGVGKITHDALYVHVSALTSLSPVLRVYEGCARAYVGEVEGANIVKLHRQKPKVSYLSYPAFDSDAHPPLVGALVVPLCDFNVKYWNWEDSDNPPILHRKEEFVSEDYPGRAKFARLTAQEEKACLYESPSGIGHLREWQQLLDLKNMRIGGHRLMKTAS